MRDKRGDVATVTMRDENVIRLWGRTNLLFKLFYKTVGRVGSLTDRICSGP